MAFFPDKPADNDEIRLGAKQIRDNFNGVINDGIVIPKPATYGSGTPKNSDGNNFERYIDILTGNEYIKITGTWELCVGLDVLYAGKSELAATREELASLAGEITGANPENGGSGEAETEGTASCYVCATYPANGVQNQGSYYWKDSAGHVTVTMRINSSYGSIISMSATPVIVMPVGFRPAFDCYAPCYAENAAWNTAAVKCGFMYLDTGGTLTVRFPVVMFKGDDFVSGQISYYAGN